jgi:hypothetical protein
MRTAAPTNMTLHISCLKDIKFNEVPVIIVHFACPWINAQNTVLNTKGGGTKLITPFERLRVTSA